MNLLKKTSILALAGAITIISCKDDDVVPDLRPDMSYDVLSATVAYSDQFKDESGATTVDLTIGNTRYKMFQAINSYAGTATTTTIDATVLKNMFSNTGTPFTGNYASLNGSTVQLKNVTASSFASADAETVRAKMDANFTDMATISASNSVTASKGVAGKLGTRLVDARGLETVQIIQKSLIGALQLDYISNVLLTDGLNADNHTLVEGKNYTQLEQNWDQAYGMLTLNPIYLAGSTDGVRGTTEFALGSYVWEYNKTNYAKIYPAFLKGRAAIVNNDRAELETQAEFIRNQLEIAIASAAIGYLGKFGTRSTDADRVHDIGEGSGFIYSLRFAKIHSVDAKFSDDVLNGLLGSSGGFWDITPAKIEAATSQIKTKFGL